MLTRNTRKRLVAAIAGIFLLLCQGLALAQACSLPAAQPDKGRIDQPCHGAGEQPDSGTAFSQGQCESVSPIASGFPLFTVDELPAVIVKVADSDLAAASVSPDNEAALLRAEPPPLRIVHCCLRN